MGQIKKTLVNLGLMFAAAASFTTPALAYSMPATPFNNAPVATQILRSTQQVRYGRGSGRAFNSLIRATSPAKCANDSFRGTRSLEQCKSDQSTYRVVGGVGLLLVNGLAAWLKSKDREP